MTHRTRHRFVLGAVVLACLATLPLSVQAAFSWILVWGGKPQYDGPRFASYEEACEAERQRLGGTSVYPGLSFYGDAPDQYGPQIVRCDLKYCADLSCPTSSNAYTSRRGDITDCPSGASANDKAACPGDDPQKCG